MNSRVFHFNNGRKDQSQKRENPIHSSTLPIHHSREVSHNSNFNSNGPTVSCFLFELNWIYFILFYSCKSANLSVSIHLSKWTEVFLLWNRRKESIKGETFILVSNSATFLQVFSLILQHFCKCFVWFCKTSASVFCLILQHFCNTIANFCLIKSLPEPNRWRDEIVLQIGSDPSMSRSGLF